MSDFDTRPILARFPEGREALRQLDEYMNLEYKYILNEQHQPVPEPDVVKWGRWFEDKRNVIVAQHTLANGYFVSTVFLGLVTLIDSRLFETMVFVLDPHNEARSLFFTGIRTTNFERQKAATWDEALAQHAAAIETCRTNPPAIDPPEEDEPQ